jgi:hypothetical protein
MGKHIQVDFAKARLRRRGMRRSPVCSGCRWCVRPVDAVPATRSTERFDSSAHTAVASSVLRLVPLRRGAVTAKLQEQTSMVLATLLPHEEQVLRMRFGIEGANERTADELGRIRMLPRDRILKIESRALRKLRRPAWIARL